MAGYAPLVLKPGPLNLESSTLTIRPLHLPYLLAMVITKLKIDLNNLLSRQDKHHKRNHKLQKSEVEVPAVTWARFMM